MSSVGEQKQVPTPEEAIRKLREIEDMLIAKQDSLEAKIGEDIASVRSNASTNRPAAIEALKLKKKREKVLLQLDGILCTVEIQKEYLQGGTAAVPQALKYVADALKTTNFNMVEVNEMIADVEDLAEKISKAISDPADFGEETDEEELERELEDLVENIPTLALDHESDFAVNAEEDEEMKKLEGWAV